MQTHSMKITDLLSLKIRCLFNPTRFDEIKMPLHDTNICNS